MPTCNPAEPAQNRWEAVAIGFCLIHWAKDDTASGWKHSSATKGSIREFDVFQGVMDLDICRYDSRTVLSRFII